ncbi:hypothetical protein Zm00014a_031537 [Zea mays]|uniref:Uncharacterized protein n=1 Tax=Zea mays TaxID=4577 RepID=A0A3L6DLJ8_MAIZE|nr:hypothetical protein Zm00014a_031537 [Zea mays]
MEHWFRRSGSSFHGCPGFARSSPLLLRSPGHAPPRPIATLQLASSSPSNLHGGRAHSLRALRLLCSSVARSAPARRASSSAPWSTFSRALLLSLPCRGAPVRALFLLAELFSALRTATFHLPAQLTALNCPAPRALAPDASRVIFGSRRLVPSFLIFFPNTEPF